MAIRLAVLVSGSGTTLQNLIDRIADRRLDATVAIVISSRPDAGAVERAQRAGVAHGIVLTRNVPVAAYSRQVFDLCRDHDAALVVLGGYLHLLQIPDEFLGRVMNIHPALIPSFCGYGCYGLRVHKAVIERGVKLTGCTVHFVDNQYDHGPIILQRGVPVCDDDTPEQLAHRVFEAECECYPEAIRLFAEGRLRVSGQRVLIKRD